MPQIVGTRQILTTSPFGLMGSGVYKALTNVYEPHINHPLDAILEVTVDASSMSAPAGDKQIIVYAKASFDGSIWQSGPESGTDDTEAEQLTRLGSLLVPTQTVHTAQFPIGQIFGWLPPYIKIILKNSCGVSVPSGTVSISVAEITGA